MCFVDIVSTFHCVDRRRICNKLKLYYLFNLAMYARQLVSFTAQSASAKFL